MQLAAAGLSSVSLGSVLLDPGASDDQALAPIMTELNGVDVRELMLANSLKIQDTLGQPVTASFTMKNAEIQVGAPLRILFYAQVIFSGTLDHIDKTSPDLQTFLYPCDGLDWSQILVRRKLARNFTNLPVQHIVDSILDNELRGEGLTMGTIDSLATLPLVDAQGAKLLEVLRTMAAATGQSFYVDFDQSIQMRSVTAPNAPLLFTEANVLIESTKVHTDRETYRNVQTVIVTGTPVSPADALVVTTQRRNESQIAERAEIEGGTGIYEEIEAITHPTSNDGVELALLGIGYANLRLATSGAPRLTVTCQVRGYGFRAGQVATVDLPTFGIAGVFAIQRVTVTERDRFFLFHELEMTNSSLQQRAYESWLAIVKGGKVTVQMPGSLTTNMQAFNVPGAYPWTVPPGITTVEVTCLGGSAGGGGAAQLTGMLNFSSNAAPLFCEGPIQHGESEIALNGGRAGNSGRAVKVIDVNPGEVLSLIVGAAGIGGVNDSNAYQILTAIGDTDSTTATDGIAGTASSVTYLGMVVCQGDGGLPGTHARMTVTRFGGSPFRSQRLCTFPGKNAVNNAAGIGDGVSVAGGKRAGTSGSYTPVRPPGDGQDGLVEVRW